MAVKSTEPRIEHVVVLMFENRSFDHMLGALDHPDPHFEGLGTGAYYNMADGPDGARIPATSDGTPDAVDPDHSNDGVLGQIGEFGGVAHNGGFVHSYTSVKGATEGPKVMCGLSPDKCPVLSELALQFAVCDHWHCSVPGETWPNRNYAHAATSDGEANIDFGFYYDKTIFEQLHFRRVKWHIYHDGFAQVWFFRKLWRRRTLIDLLMFRRPKIGNWFNQSQFDEHVRTGQLPAYSFIEPAQMPYFHENELRGPTSSQHPHNNVGNADDFYRGEQLLRSVYRSLAENPEVFAKTLLVVTYDEHGGTYDHVSPPPAVPPGDPVWRGLTRRIAALVRTVIGTLQQRPHAKKYDFTRSGVRVPALLISPWIKPGTLVRTPLEHASIPKTLRALFAPRLASLTKRDSPDNHDVGTFHDVVRTSALDTPRTLPPGPDDPGGPAVNAFPLPSLDAPAATAPPATLTAAQVLPPTDLSDFQEQLVRLAARVDGKLSYRSAASLPKRRAHARQRAEGIAAPVDVTTAPHVMDKFAAQAGKARTGVRGTTRRSG